MLREYNKQILFAIVCTDDLWQKKNLALEKSMLPTKNQTV